MGVPTIIEAQLRASLHSCSLLQGGFDISQYGCCIRYCCSSQVEVSQSRQGSDQTIIALDETRQPSIERGIDGRLCIRERFCLGRWFPLHIHKSVMPGFELLAYICLILGLS